MTCVRSSWFCAVITRRRRVGVGFVCDIRAACVRRSPECGVCSVILCVLRCPMMCVRSSWAWCVVLMCCVCVCFRFVCDWRAIVCGLIVMLLRAPVVHGRL